MVEEARGRAPKLEDVQAIEALLPTVACLQRAQWDRRYFFDRDWRKTATGERRVFDFTKIYIAFTEVVDSPPYARSDGRPPVQAGRIFIVKGEDTWDDYIDMNVGNGAYGEYVLASRTLNVKCSPVQQRNWMYAEPEAKLGDWVKSLIASTARVKRP